jgi:hypothetical protein
VRGSLQPRDRALSGARDLGIVILQQRLDLRQRRGVAAEAQGIDDVEPKPRVGILQVTAQRRRAARRQFHQILPRLLAQPRLGDGVGDAADRTVAEQHRRERRRERHPLVPLEGGCRLDARQLRVVAETGQPFDRDAPARRVPAGELRGEHRCAGRVRDSCERIERRVAGRVSAVVLKQIGQRLHRAFVPHRAERVHRRGLDGHIRVVQRRDDGIADGLVDRRIAGPPGKQASEDARRAVAQRRVRRADKRGEVRSGRV